MSGYGHPILDGLTGYVGTWYVDGGAFADVLPTAPNGEHPAVGFSCLLPLSSDTGLLHLEEVRVVGPRFQNDEALRRLLGVVMDGELLLEAGPDFPQPFHDQWAVRVAVGPGDPCNNAARNGSFVSAVRGSSACPFTVSRQVERILTPATKRPCARSA